MKYTIQLSNKYPLEIAIEEISIYIGFDKIDSSYRRLNLRYESKTRDINFNEYRMLKRSKAINTCFKSEFVRALAEKELEYDDYTIYAELSEIEAIILSSKSHVDSVIRTPILKPRVLQSDNSDSLRLYKPNNNYGLIVNNNSFFNFNENGTNYFNAEKTEYGKNYTYNETIDEPIDIIVIDNGVYAEHENFIRNDGTNICQYKLEQQKNLPWRLSNLLELTYNQFQADESVPEGVSRADPSYVGYYIPTIEQINLNKFNHGTHCAGIIAGTYSGWVRGKNVRLHSIPYLSDQMADMGKVIELAIIDFQISKIAKGDYSPTVINRSYGSGYDYENTEKFSNLDGQHNTGLLFKKNPDNSISIKDYQETIFRAIQRNLGVINCFAGGNSTELMITHSTDQKNYYNKYYIRDNFVYYPYRPLDTIIKKEYYTINGLKLDEIDINFANNQDNLNFFTSRGIELNYELLLNSDNNINLSNTYLLVDETPVSYIIGSVGIRNEELIYRLNSVGYSKYIYTAPSRFSSFGNALYFTNGSNILSSIAIKDGTLNKIAYEIQSGTSMATPNLIGILSIYLSYVYKNKWISVEKKNITYTIQYTNDYLNKNSILFSKNLNNDIDLFNYFSDFYSQNNQYTQKKINSYKDIYPYYNPGNPNFIITDKNSDYKIVYLADMTKITEPIITYPTVNNGNVIGNITNGNVTGNITNDNVIESIINNGTITGSVINNGIIFGNITNNGIIVGSIINNGNIIGSIINNGNILGNTITNGNIIGNTITNGNIIGNTITNGNIIGNTITNGNIIGNTITNGNIVRSIINNGIINGFIINNGTLNQ